MRKRSRNHRSPAILILGLLVGSLWAVSAWATAGAESTGPSPAVEAAPAATVALPLAFDFTPSWLKEGKDDGLQAVSLCPNCDCYPGVGMLGEIQCRECCREGLIECNINPFCMEGSCGPRYQMCLAGCSGGELE